MSDQAAAIAGLMLEVCSLRGLRAWEPVGSALDELPAALRGQGTLTAGQVSRLRRWARRWRGLAPSLRAFYEAEANEPGGPTGIVEAALWRLLEGDRRVFTPRQGILLKLAWRDRYGSMPSADLCPRLPDLG